MTSIIITPINELPYVSYEEWYSARLKKREDIELNQVVYRGNTAEEILSIPSLQKVKYFIINPVISVDGVGYTAQTYFAEGNLEEADETFRGFLKRHKNFALHSIRQGIGSIANGHSKPFVLQIRGILLWHS